MKFSRVILLIAAFASVGTAQGRGRGRGHDKQDHRVRTVYTVDDRRSDARIIASWYQSHPREWNRIDMRANGGYYRDRARVFYPGYDRRIVRSVVLPREYRTYVRPVPYAVISLLPPVRRDWEYVLLDDRVLLVDRPSWMVIDVVVRLS